MVGVNSFAFRSAASPKTRKTNLQENSTVLRKTGPKTRGKFEPRMEPILVQKWTNFWSKNGPIFGPKMDQFLVEKTATFICRFFPPKKKATFICRFCQQPLFARFGNLVPRASSTARRQSPSPENPGTLAGERKSNLYLQIFQQPLFAEKKKATFICTFTKSNLYLQIFFRPKFGKNWTSFAVPRNPLPGLLRQDERQVLGGVAGDHVQPVFGADVNGIGDEAEHERPGERPFPSGQVRKTFGLEKLARPVLVPSRDLPGLRSEVPLCLQSGTDRVSKVGLQDFLLAAVRHLPVGPGRPARLEYPKTLKNLGKKLKST